MEENALMWEWSEVNNLKFFKIVMDNDQILIVMVKNIQKYYFS